MLTLNQAMCPVCREISIEPVTMPCDHIVCSQCFQMTVEKSNLTCPLCRRRLGSWLRTATNKGRKIVNSKLWDLIRVTFPAEVKAKLAGLEIADSAFNGLTRRQLSKPGEIRRDYEKSLEEARKEEEEEQRKREEEERASEEFIRKLHEEELNVTTEEKRKAAQDEAKAKELILRLEAEDAEKQRLALKQSRADRRLAAQLLDVPGTSKTVVGPMDLYVRSLSNLSSSSNDSITPETLHYFKPLKPYPITPPKLAFCVLRLTPVASVTCAVVNEIQGGTLLSSPHGSAFKGCRALFQEETSLENVKVAPDTPDPSTPEIPDTSTDTRSVTLQSCDLSETVQLRLESSPELSEKVQPSPDLSERVESSPDFSERVQQSPDLSERVQPSPDFSETVQLRLESSPELSERVESSPDFSDVLVEQQRLAEKLAKQEHEDFLMAQRLQREFNHSSNQVGSNYQLRRGVRRQATLDESFAPKKTKDTPRKRKAPTKTECSMFTRIRPQNKASPNVTMRDIIDGNVKRFRLEEETKRTRDD